MIYNIHQINRSTKKRMNTFLIDFKNDEDMSRYCFAMDDDLYFFYGEIPPQIYD